ncbi:hypothetical protein D3C71_1989670 [compost metagenome]
MPLVRADALAIIAQCKALLVAGRHDVLKSGMIERLPVCSQLLQQLVDVGPALAVQDQPDFFGLMAQHQTEELAGVLG